MLQMHSFARECRKCSRHEPSRGWLHRCRTLADQQRQLGSLQQWTCSMRPQPEPQLRHQGIPVGLQHLERMDCPRGMWVLSDKHHYDPSQYWKLIFKYTMQNFEIEGSTGQDLTHSVQSASAENKASQEPIGTTQDTLDVLNCGLQIVFKIVSILVYLLLKLLTNSYLATFVLTVLLLSIDFWTTKNLTARKLVGLRWWSEIGADGNQEWVFESRNPSRVPHGVNVGIFWISQLVALVFWAIIAIINVFTLSIFWIGLALFCEMLTAINFACFFKCRGDHQRKAKEFGSKFGIRAIGEGNSI